MSPTFPLVRAVSLSKTVVSEKDLPIRYLSFSEEDFIIVHANKAFQAAMNNSFVPEVQFTDCKIPEVQFIAWFA